MSVKEILCFNTEVLGKLLKCTGRAALKQGSVEVTLRFAYYKSEYLSYPLDFLTDKTLFMFKASHCFRIIEKLPTVIGLLIIK